MTIYDQKENLNRSPGGSKTNNDQDGLLASIFPDRWSISYVAVLVYAFAIITDRFPLLPLGTSAIVIGLISLALTKQSLRSAPPVNWMALFLAWASVGYFASDYQSVVADNLFTFFKLVLIAFLTINAIRTRKQALFFLIFASACFLYYPIRVTLLNYFVLGYTSFGRAVGGGFYSNSNDLAALTLLQMSAVLAISVVLKQRWARWGAIFLGLVMAVVIVLTQSRGAFLGAIAMLALIVGSAQKKAGIILGIFFALGVITTVVPSSAFNRFETFTSVVRSKAPIGEADREGSAAERQKIYRIALMISADHPVAGVGLGAYRYANADYDRREIGGGVSGSNTKDAHSTYLSTLAESGIPGLLMILMMFGRTLGPANRTRKLLLTQNPPSAKQIGLLVSGYFGFLVAAIVGTYSNFAIIYVHLCVIWALCETYRKADCEDKTRGETVGRSD